MVDRLSTEQRSANMGRIKSRDTKPALLVRRIARVMGYRYRLHRKDLPGKPDLVFRTRRKVVFVHGCFWHQHGSCRAGRVPGSNAGHWVPKLRRCDGSNMGGLQGRKPSQRRHRPERSGLRHYTNRARGAHHHGEDMRRLVVGWRAVLHLRSWWPHKGRRTLDVPTPPNRSVRAVFRHHPLWQPTSASTSSSL